MASMKTLVLADIDWYKTLRDYFNQRGLHGEQILTFAGLSGSAEFNQPRRYYSDAVSEAFREMVRLTSDPASGLQTYHPLSHLGVLSHVMQSAGTVEQALIQTSRYLHLFWPIAHIQMPSADENGIIRLSLISGQGGIPGELYDFFITGVINSLRMITDMQPQTLKVCRPGPSPANKTPWQQAFGCPVVFDASECSITLDRAYLQRSLPTSNSTVFDFCTKLLEQISEQRGHSIKAQIRAILPAHLARGKVRRETIASLLDMSERTLCRRIASEGTTFAHLVDELRRDLAKRHIQQGHSPTEIAYTLGFSDPSNFYRACRRWFGIPPALLITSPLSSAS
jgi:AraC-like DNA-binding protein